MGAPRAGRRGGEGCAGGADSHDLRRAYSIWVIFSFLGSAAESTALAFVPAAKDLQARREVSWTVGGIGTAVGLSAGVGCALLLGECGAARGRGVCCRGD